MTVRAISGGWIKNGRGSAGGASLNLNFLNGITDYRITYSGGVNGTRVNSAGTIVAAVAPRYDYDPVTLAARGLLVEEARTNLALRSEEFDNAAWTKTGVTVSANSIVAPSGATTADTLTQDGTTNIHGVLVASAINVTSGTVYSHSVYAKAGASTILQLTFGNASSTFTGLGYTNFDLSTGAVVGSGGTLVASGIQDAGGGWYRCFISATATATAASNPYFVIANSAGYTRLASYAGDGTSGLYLWGAQLEAGAFPTSYIPTTTATVARTADTAVMTGTNFSRWYNQTEGTFVATGTTNRPFGAGVGGQMLSAATDADNRLWISQGTTTNALHVTVNDGGAGQAIINTGGTSAGVTNIEAAFAYAANNFAASLNGATPGTDVAGSVPTCNALYIGGSFTGSAVGNWNGHLRSIAYYPRRLSNEQLQALTV